MSGLEALIGEWDMEAMGQVRGHATFEWLDGGPFVVERWSVDAPEFPDGIAVFTGDRQHYFDSRGVARVYETSLADGVWKLYRESSDPFWQRFVGRFSQDGRTIEGAWEKSDDGTDWQVDFALTYRRTE